MFIYYFLIFLFSTFGEIFSVTHGFEGQEAQLIPNFFWMPDKTRMVNISIQFNFYLIYHNHNFYMAANWNCLQLIWISKLVFSKPSENCFQFLTWKLKIHNISTFQGAKWDSKLTQAQDATLELHWTAFNITWRSIPLIQDVFTELQSVTVIP